MPHVHNIETPILYATTGAADGRRLTWWPSLKTDLRDARAKWVDEEAMVDDNLVTSRNPDDIPTFNRAMIELFTRVSAAAGHVG